MAITDLQAESACATSALMPAASVDAADPTLVSARLPVETRTNASWDEAKAAYLASAARTDDLYGPYAEAERALCDDSKTAPIATITYTQEGFKVGAVTMASYDRTVELSYRNYEWDHDDLRDHPDYIAYCAAVAAWEARPERVTLMQREQETEGAWNAAVSANAEIWDATATFHLNDAHAIAEKIALLQPEAGTDGGWLTTLINAVAADLARANGIASHDPAKWNELLAAYEHLKAETAASDAQESPQDRDEAIAYGKENERLAWAHGQALDAVLLAPAPDLRALSTKLRIFNDWQVEDGWHTAREIVEQLAADSRRLLGEA